MSFYSNQEAQLLNSLPYAFGLMEQDGNLLFANMKLAEIYKKQPQEILGFAWLDHFDPENEDSERKRWILRQFQIRRKKRRIYIPDENSINRVYLFDTTPIFVSGVNLLQATLIEVTDRHHHLLKTRQFQRSFAREMKLAANTQNHLNNFIIHFLEGRFFKYHFSSLFLASEYLSGDVLNVNNINRRYSSFFIGDGRGHGLTAALYSGLINSYLNYLAMQVADGITDIRELVSRINKTAHSDFSRGEEFYFFSAIFGLIDGNGKTLHIVNAGHPYPLVYKNGQVTEVETHGPMVGVIPDATYSYSSFELDGGEVFLLFTDGLTEISIDKSNPVSREEDLKLFVKQYFDNGGKPEKLKIAIERDFLGIRNVPDRKRLNDDIAILILSIEQKPQST